MSSTMMNGNDTAVASKRPSDESQQHDSLTKKARHEEEAKTTSKETIPDPIIPCHVSTPSTARWTVEQNCLLLRHEKTSPKTKIAAFDLGGTLLVSRVAGYPTQPHDYQVWSASAFQKLQELSNDGYQLVLFINEGRIRTAFTGKAATRTKGIVDWLATQLKCPLHAVISTSTKSGHHKPNAGMWNVYQQKCCGETIDLEQSFYVGDRDGTDEEIEDTDKRFEDKRFAENVSLKFYTPRQYFGDSDSYRRKAAQASQMSNHDAPPPTALKTRAALLGGYVRGPIMLILCGAQGCGKSTFCERLLQQGDNSHWVHLSQDTIRNGKPGKREVVEAAASEALRNGHSVIIDRTHLTPEQRLHFLQVAPQDVPVHAVTLYATHSQLARRVRERENHPSGVQGDKYVKMAISSQRGLVPPTYKEGFALISVASRSDAANHLADLYRGVGMESPSNAIPSRFCLFNSAREQDEPASFLPSISLGTYKLGKRIAASTVTLARKNGIAAIDTAPTYDNEERIGEALDDADTFVIVKVPKRATQPAQVRTELFNSLQKLNRDAADLVLLHWPCDFIEAGTLQVVWKELETMKSEGYCKNLGVSNFSVGALQALLPFCRACKPVVNQVERHPLLPQWELLDFCNNQGIVLQAHTPLGQGRSELLEHPTIARIAAANNRTAAQIVLQWNLQQGVAVVPKCSSESHVDEVAHVLTGQCLTPTQLGELNAIGASNQKRFVEPPFMYKAEAAYSWGNRVPMKGK